MMAAVEIDIFAFSIRGRLSRTISVFVKLGPKLAPIRSLNLAPAHRWSSCVFLVQVRRLDHPDQLEGPLAMHDKAFGI